MISEPTAPVAAALPPADAGGRAVLARRASVVSIAVLASRVLGVVREQIFAVFFGAGRELDAFITAFRIPNLFRDLFAEGALSAAFVSTFTQEEARRGPVAAWRLANLVVNALALIVGGVCLAGIVFAPTITDAIAPGFATIPGKTALRQVLRLMAPATIGAAAVQVNVFVNSNFASYLGDGPVSWLNVAFRFMQLPIGLFGVAVGTVALPALSRHVAAGDTDALART